MEDWRVEPREVKQRLEPGDSLLLVDVREPWEHEICRIEGARLIPLGVIPPSVALFERAEDVVRYCGHGIHSLDAAAWLQAQGVEGARSLAGGIERWATVIDASVPCY